MKMNKYQKLAIRTCVALPSKYDHLNHAIMGLVSEVGEVADAFKKFKYYGQPIDNANIIEELGDILWYVALAAQALRCDLDYVASENIAKLQKRYPEKFTEECAKERADKS